MVLELAVNAVQKKLELNCRTMLGNYEFYYASGILCRLSGNILDEETLKQPKEMQKKEMALGYTAKNQQEETLLYMLKHYDPDDKTDEQMMELYQRGINGSY